MMMEALHTGKVIKQIRLQKKYSVRKVAAMAGITASMLSQIENEQTNPSLNTLRSIAQVLEEPLYKFSRTGPLKSTPLFILIHARLWGLNQFPMCNMNC